MSIVNRAVIKASVLVDTQPAYGDATRSRLSINMQGIGAFSFILYGLESVGTESVMGKFNPFEGSAREAPALPSLYSGYLFLERAMTKFVYDAYVDKKIIDRKFKLIVRFIVEMLQLYFVSLDPSTEKRIMYYLEHAAEFLIGPDAEAYIMPSVFFRSDAVVGRRTRALKDGVRGPGVSRFDIYQALKTLGVEFIPEFGVMDQPFRRVLYKYDNIEEFYIVRNKVRPTPYVTVDKEVRLLYAVDLSLYDARHVADPNEPTTIENLEALLNRSKFLETDSLSIDGIHAMMEEENIDILRVGVGHTSFKFIEHAGHRDVVAERPSISISEDDEKFERKFRAEGIPIYVRKAPLTALENDVFEKTNPTFRVHCGVSLQDLERRLVNFGSADKHDLDIFDTATLRLQTGAVLAAPLQIVTRDQEAISIVDRLENQIQRP